MSNLNQLQSYLLASLGDPYDELRWTEGLLEQSLRLALADFSTYGEDREDLFTVTVAGYEQDLSSLGAKEITSISWPSDDGYQHMRNLLDFRMVGESTVRFDTWQVPLGEVLRVRYSPLHTIDGLDGATTTTLYDAEEHPLLLLAASRACDLRARRMLMKGEDKSQIGFFRSVSNEYRIEFEKTISLPRVLEWGQYYED